MSTFVNGYIICHENKCLTKNLFWYPHESIENAYVFPWWQADDVIEMAEKWKLQPTHIFAATPGRTAEDVCNFLVPFDHADDLRRQMSSDIEYLVWNHYVRRDKQNQSLTVIPEAIR
jgi:hypothetical protein